jgi:hypothetical protein
MGPSCGEEGGTKKRTRFHLRPHRGEYRVRYKNGEAMPVSPTEDTGIASHRGFLNPRDGRTVLLYHCECGEGAYGNCAVRRCF